MPDETLLLKHGFIKQNAKHNYWYDENTKIWKPRGEGKYVAKDADQETAEEVNIGQANEYVKTGFPKPGKRYKIIRESFAQGIEETYFWLLNYLEQELGYNDIIKIQDIFSASENSAFFGASQQRLGLQQDRISQYLKGTAEMVKQLFQLVRELRIIDERLTLYEQYHKSNSANQTLKGLYVDLVGGTKNPGSVLGLASQVGYTVLPDLFFNSKSHTKEAVDKEVDDLEFNNQVKSILRRKLYAYLTWVEKTHEEHKVRKKFQLQYLRQHWAIIKMYMSWIKPYLKNVSRLTMNEKQMDSPYLIGAFETSMTEIELLAHKPGDKEYRSVLMLNFEFRTKAAMNFTQDYQRGPQHVGRVTWAVRSYAWTEQQIDAYRRMKDEEDMELLGLVDHSVKSAMDALGQEFRDYLKEANAELDEDTVTETPEPKKWDWESSMAGPFIQVFAGFKDIFQDLFGIHNMFKSTPKASGNQKKVLKTSNVMAFLPYKFYKKSHGMLTW